ncbi:MAG: hypothetical protein KDC99_16415 [Cyclobacteriaceae bacterium]|nr:hypothetical protein [Cyclobacteriaceae bacterium]
MAIVVAWTLAIHLAICVVTIVYPSLADSFWIARFYHRYVLIGPFFSTSTVEQSKLLLVSWKTGDQWSAPINPAYDNYVNYFNKVNPIYFYMSSLERDMYEKVTKDTARAAAGIVDSVRLKALKSYLKGRYIPPCVDSTRVIWLNEYTHNFTSRVDTLLIIEY